MISIPLAHDKGIVTVCDYGARCCDWERASRLKEVIETFDLGSLKRVNSAWSIPDKICNRSVVAWYATLYPYLARDSVEGIAVGETVHEHAPAPPAVETGLVVVELGLSTSKKTADYVIPFSAVYHYWLCG
jgi:hypothetical protein